MHVKETSIFDHAGNKIITEDREITIIAKMEEPKIAILGNIVTDAECEELIRLSKDRLNRSKIGAQHEVNNIRTSSSTFLPDDDITAARIEKRIAQIMNVPVEHGEGLHILNYKQGQEYKAHYDYFKSKVKTVNNPRISTLVLYLNDVEEGGETYFPKMNLSVSPHKGMGVYFEYFYSNPVINERTLHGGYPVTAREKWAATMWVRRKQYR
ncbi:2OG-Fe(II) oxygenase [Halobacillus massiliensis]|uniref:2OG-Fe(II) oxygenase n=1 Tax=Halobacillus massiliensis TaxID=1926286 RepID=UPI0009E33828|nr:2OG-Fe(II) oxygenase [Halobacillus massiliensis]